MQNQLKNKYVLVTGANSGIGLQIAKDFLSEGAFVAAHFYGGKQEASGLLEYAEPGQCQFFEADFSSSAEIDRFWQKYISWSNGQIDVLVNNAGDISSVHWQNLSEEVWDRIFQINLKAPFFLSRHAFSIMSKNKSGRIINISSIGVKFGGSLKTMHYSASKAALEAVTKSLAKAGASHNVLVTAVRPGVTRTPLYKKLGQTDLKSRIALIPLKRMAEPSEISSAVIFLAKSAFITDTIIEVSGGE